MRYLSLALVLIGLGCTSIPKNEYIEGTALTIGLYIPMNGTVYGIQAVNYLSGTRIRTFNTNDFPHIERQHSVTNSSFGCFQMTENNKTVIK